MTGSAISAPVFSAMFRTQAKGEYTLSMDRPGSSACPLRS